MAHRPGPRNTCPWAAASDEVLDYHTKDLANAAARRERLIGSVQGEAASDEVSDYHTRDLETAAKRRAYLQQVPQGHVSLSKSPRRVSVASEEAKRAAGNQQKAALSYASPRGGQDMVQVELIMRCIEDGASGEEMRKMLQQHTTGMKMASALFPKHPDMVPNPGTMAAKRFTDFRATPRIKPELEAHSTASSRKAYNDAQQQVVATRYRNSRGNTDLLKMEVVPVGPKAEALLQQLSDQSAMKSRVEEEHAYMPDRARDVYLQAKSESMALQYKAKNPNGGAPF